MSEIRELVAAALDGKREALARLLSIAERGGTGVLEIEKLIAPRVGRAWVIGVTGPPGAGKSTLINALLPHARSAFGRAAVLAVDPSSPFSSGAILGDRVRMQGQQLGPSVFIRSMASRGEMGGLARAASTCVRLFDACGWPVVIVETLGIGQVELDIMDLADTVVVVLNPGWGDTIQANKAGLTEAGDLFVINKADKPGAQQTRKDLLESLALLAKERKPDIVDTGATGGEGLEALWQAIEAQRGLLAGSTELNDRRALRHRRLVKKTIAHQIEHSIARLLGSERGERLLADASLGEIDLSRTIADVLALVAQDVQK